MQTASKSTGTVVRRLAAAQRFFFRSEAYFSSTKEGTSTKAGGIGLHNVQDRKYSAVQCSQCLVQKQFTIQFNFTYSLVTYLLLLL